MGRYIGLWTNKGKGGGGLGPVKPFTRSSGISTDSNNNVTEVTLDNIEYTKMFYNNVGLVTGYNENFGGNKKGWVITYTSQNLVDTVVERVPPHPTPQYDISASTTSLDENSTVTFNLSTVDVPDAMFYWRADGSNVTGSDFTGGTVTGTVQTSGGAGQISLTTAEDVSTEGNETFEMKIYADAGLSQLLATSPTVTITDSSVASFEHTAYYTPGSYSWTCPAGVTKARVIVIGGGGGGGADGGGAGGGAAMKYWSNLSPGTSYSLTVGSGGQRLNSSNGNNGSDSSFAGPGNTITGTGGSGWGNGGNTGQYGGGAGQGSGGDVNGTGGNGSPYANDPVSSYGYTTNPQGSGSNGGAGGGGGGADNGPAINGGAGSYFAGGGGGGGSDNGQGGDGGNGGPSVIYEFEQTGYTRAFGGGGGGTDGTNGGVFGGPGGSYGGGTGQGYGDGSYPLHGGHGGGYADGAGGGHRGEGQGQNAGGGGGGAFGGGGGGAGHQDANNVAGAGGHGLVYITWGASPPTGY